MSLPVVKRKVAEKQSTGRRSPEKLRPDFGTKTNTPCEQYNIILIGATGVGKSACGNTILNKNAFVSKKSIYPVTQKVKMGSAIFDGVNLHVYDTPGLFDPDRNNENLTQLESLLQSKERICTVVLLVMKADRLTPEDEKVLHLIEDFIPEVLIRNTWILFTRGDELEREDLTIEKFIEKTPLKNIVQKLHNRFHLFNNFSQSLDQVRSLIYKIKEATININLQKKCTPPKSDDPEEDPLHRRIMLVGKTGYGKSATGNTILGTERFRSRLSLCSVTVNTETERAVIAGRNLTVIDTPGLFEMTTNSEKIVEEIAKSIIASAPGPHAFLYVQPINIRFTTQEENVIEKLEMIFGKDMKKYIIILFTHGDLLESVDEESVIHNNQYLSEVINECGGRYHIFNNKDNRRKQQVTELLEKIDKMVEQNGGSYYTNEMFKESERFVQSERQQKKEKEIETELMNLLIRKQTMQKEIKQLELRMNELQRKKYQIKRSYQGQTRLDQSCHIS